MTVVTDKVELLAEDLVTYIQDNASVSKDDLLEEAQSLLSWTEFDYADYHAYVTEVPGVFALDLNPEGLGEPKTLGDAINRMIANDVGQGVYAWVNEAYDDWVYDFCQFVEAAEEIVDNLEASLPAIMTAAGLCGEQDVDLFGKISVQQFVGRIEEEYEIYLDGVAAAQANKWLENKTKS